MGTVIAVFRFPIAIVLAAPLLWSQAAFFPLADVKPGLKGVGRTVFQGSRIEQFDVEILGVLEGVGPKQSIILGRLSGGPLASTGVMQGMSGSPVYIDGKLVGAVALAFQFAKEPIAGIRPIEEMVRVGPASGTRPLARTEVATGESRLVEISTPLSFQGFTRNTIEHFSPQLRDLGFSVQQGTGGGGKIPDRLGDPSRLQPGSMISVQMMTGDMAVGADGTVTHIDKDAVYAFGHRLSAAGSTEFPFAIADVLTLLPNVANSFKISAAREWMGVITQDRNAAIAGVTGRKASLVPISITVRPTTNAPPETYRLRMVNNRVFSPLLLQMAVFSALDVTERAAGGSAISLKGKIEFEGASEPVVIDNAYASDVALPAFASIAAVLPLSFAFQNTNDLQIRSVNLTLEADERRRYRQIDQLWTNVRNAKPGDEIEIRTLIVGEQARETAFTTRYKIPVGEHTGTLYITVSDAPSVNVAELTPLSTPAPRTVNEVVSLLNRQRSNRQAYLRVWRSEPGYTAGPGEIAGPPSSITLLLQKSSTATASWRGTTLAEIPLAAADSVVTGSKTVQVEIKE
jgi:hypothetical protein